MERGVEKMAGMPGGVRVFHRVIGAMLAAFGIDPPAPPSITSPPARVTEARCVVAAAREASANHARWDGLPRRARAVANHAMERDDVDDAPAPTFFTREIFDSVEQLLAMLHRLTVHAAGN